MNARHLAEDITNAAASLVLALVATENPTGLSRWAARTSTIEARLAALRELLAKVEDVK